MEPQRLARYPFLPEAGRWASTEGPDVEELLTGTAWQRARERGIERVDAALTDDRTPQVPPPSAATATEPLLEVLSYPVARMIVSAVDKPILTRRYAEAEAKAANERMRAEGEVGLIELARALGLEVARRDDDLAMHVTSYLSHLKGIREDWTRLVNQRVTDGWVLLEPDRFARVVQEAIRDKILDELPLATSRAIHDALEDEIARLGQKAEMLAKEFEPEPLGEVRLDLIPPCMQALLGRLQAGENVPHQGRFAITAFLSKIGMDADRIVDLFSSAPDFKEDVTRYQVEHITGESSTTEYTPPACQTMVTYGLCVNKDALCEHISHPLSYYRVKYEDAEDEEEDDPEDEADEVEETAADGA